MMRVVARLVTKWPLEHVPLDSDPALNQQCTTAEQRLHESREWSTLLPHNRVQMIVHYYKSNQIDVARRNRVGHITDNVLFQFVVEPMNAALSAGDQVKNTAGRVGSQ